MAPYTGAVLAYLKSVINIIIEYGILLRPKKISGNWGLQRDVLEPDTVIIQKVQIIKLRGTMYSQLCDSIQDRYCSIYFKENGVGDNNG
jgi:hypothetical protein